MIILDKIKRELDLQGIIVNNMAEGVCIIRDSDGVIVYANPKFEKIFGYPAGELNGKSVNILNYSDETVSAGKTARNIIGEINSRGEFTYEVHNVKKDGTPFWCRSTASHYNHPDYGKVYVAVQADITESKRIKEELRESEKKYRELIEQCQEGIWVIDADLYTTFTNNKMCEMLGYTEEEMIGKHLFSFMNEQFAEKAKAGIERGKKGIKEQHEVEFLRKDGHKIYTLISTSPVIDDKGNYKGALAFISDITKRKEGEEKLKDYSEKLEEMVKDRTEKLEEAREKLVRQERLALLGKLAGTVGHELRNPLGVISNAVYFLQMVFSSGDERLKDYLKIISDEVKKSDKIISDLLDFSRIKSIDKIEVYLWEILPEILKKYQVKEKIKVINRLSKELPCIYADRAHMFQIFGNLIINACQSMPDGGELIIDGEFVENSVNISIGDTGCGISEENMNKIFEPLFTTKPRGIGLGLCVCKNLLEANGGKIYVKSIEHKGTTFTVTLPVNCHDRPGHNEE